MVAKRPHSRPPSGIVSNAVKRGMHHSSPNRQWKARSLKYSELYERASMVTIWSAAEGAVSRLLARVLNLPTLFSVRVRYACTGVAGMYATRPTKYKPQSDLSDQAALTSAKVAGSLRAVKPLDGSSRRMRLIMMTSCRSVYQGLGQRTDLVSVGHFGRYRKDTMPMTMVSRPSKSRSQNQPERPLTPRISRNPAASRAEMTPVDVSLRRNLA